MKLLSEILSDSYRNAKIQKQYDVVHSVYGNKRLSDDEKTSVRHYGMNGHTKINNTLRNIDTLTPEYSKHIENIKSAISKQITPRKVIVYAGVRNKPDDSPLKSIQSTSLHPAVAESFSLNRRNKQDKHNHVIKIHVPKGASVLFLDKHITTGGENEVLLHPGVKLKVHPVPQIKKDSFGDTYHYWTAHMTHDGIKEV